MVTFPIPSSAIARHIAVVGMTGSGKTSTSKLIVEHVAASGARICVLDPIKSDWWGITSSADGASPGLPFAILGGSHGHVPLTSSAGTAVGKLVAGGDLPLSIVDMADFEPGGLQRFFCDFADALFRNMQGVVHLVIEEAHEFAPKERAGIGNENAAIHWAKRLATAGRSKGIRLMVATQRVQALHNAVLGSCETLIAHRLVYDADQMPVIKWLKGIVNREKVDQVTGSLSALSALPAGEAWVCSGEAQIFERMTFPKFATWDNTATPTGNGDVGKVRMAEVDLPTLHSSLDDAITEAAADDPKALRAEIARLKAEMSAIAKTDDVRPLAVEEANRAGYRRGRADAAIEFHNAVSLFRQAWDDARWFKRLSNAAEALTERSDTSLRQHTARPAPRVPLRSPSPDKPAARSDKPNGVSVNRIAESVKSDDLSGPQRQLLASLAWWAAVGHAAPSRAQVVAICGWKVTSGHVKNIAGSLRSRGLIDYPSEGAMALTPAGGKAAPKPDMQASLEENVVAMLTGPQRQVLAALPKDGEAMDRSAVAKRCGWEATSGHIKNVLGSLRSLEIIDYPAQGFVARAGWLTATREAR